MASRRKKKKRPRKPKRRARTARRRPPSRRRLKRRNRTRVRKPRKKKTRKKKKRPARPRRRKKTRRRRPARKKARKKKRPLRRRPKKKKKKRTRTRPRRKKPARRRKPRRLSRPRKPKRHRPKSRRPRRRPGRQASTVLRGWAKWPKERLLEARICDLGLSIDKSPPLKACIRRLYRELRAREFVFRPHFWLSSEWYTPDNIPGVAIPFFLANPRLRKLEGEIMLEVEGGTQEWCLKVIRHEAGHALLNAYALNHRRDWQQVFGRSSIKYPETYLPRPYSKSYVIHLENWYAQAHPHEDWAETFAVWLRPGSDWRKRYKGWPALKKLEYVDRLMKEIRGKPPKLRNRRTVEDVRKMRVTLRDYYNDKQTRYAADSPEFFDRDLRRLFSEAPEHKTNEKASQYIRRVRKDIIEIVGRWTSEYTYRINEVLNDMVTRCNELNLRVWRDDQAMKDEIIACLTVLVMNKLHSGGFHVSL